MKNLFLSVVFGCVLFGCSTNPVNPPSVPPGDSFSLLIFSDPQLFWYNRPDGACGEGDAGPDPDPPTGTCPYVSGETKEDCDKRCGIHSNTYQVASIDNVHSLTWPDDLISVRAGQPISGVVGAIINGDLTAFWHSGQKEAYIDFYQDKESNLPKIPVFAGLGNHDYYNNVCDCGRKGNGCARDAVSTIRAIYKNVDGISYDDCSLSYSFDINEFHVVQMHLNPSYSVDLRYARQCEPNMFRITRSECDGKKIIGGSVGWLRQDLADATAAGKYIILNMHAAGDSSRDIKFSDEYWGYDSGSQERNKQSFATLINENNVVAIFGGHIHPARGYMGSYELGGNLILNSSEEEVPWFRSGASEYYTYLVAEFGQDPTSNSRYMNVGVVSSESEGSVFINGNGPIYGNAQRYMPPATFLLD